MTALECDASGFLRLCDVSRLTERELPLAMRRIGSRAVDVAQEAAPVYTPGTNKDGTPRKGHTGGTLRQSIAYQTGRDGSTYWAQIGTNVHYAPYQEFGTGQRGSASYTDNQGETHVTEGLTFRGDWKGIPPHPYIRPALYDQKALYMAVISDAVKRSVKKGGTA